ncbi:MAG: TonB family protein [Desulfomonilia bacterium]|nr:TonB family protein [Desulfomonilia bacterium]
MNTFVAVSLILHLVIFFSLVDMRMTSTVVDFSEVYEVSIVTEVPSETKSAPAQPPPAPGGKRYFYQRGAQAPSISEIKRDRGLKDHAPELSPADIKPGPKEPQETESPPEGVTRDRAASSTAAQQVPHAGTPGAADAVTLWKAQVKSLVDRVWKTPPEISIMDMSLQTTYLLRVSRNGDLLQKRLLISSGNSPFDRSVLLALNSITELPPPPRILVAGQDSVEITMSFTPPKEKNR